MIPERRRLVVSATVAVMLTGCGQAATPSAPGAEPSASVSTSAPAAATPSSEPLTLTGTIVFDRLEGGFGYESPYVGTYAMDLSGSSEDQVPIDLEVEGLSPNWAPDGARLLVHIFVWPEIPGRPGIMDPDGSNFGIVEVDGLIGSLVCSAWSPDGSALLCSLDDDAHPESEGIYSVAVDGSDLRQITASPNPSAEGSISACGGNDFSPAASPDGNQIAFLRAECGPGEDPSAGQQATLCVVNADGTGLEEIVGDRIPNSHGYSRVRWSPDGRRILFGSEDGQLYVVNPDGSDLTTIDLDHDDPESFAYTPEWSPDGSVILFSLFSQGSTDLYAAYPDGTNVTRITEAPDSEVWASWMP